MSRIDIQLRFSDFDIMGHVNNAKYMDFIDLGIDDYLNNTLCLNYDLDKASLIVKAKNIVYEAQIKRNESIAVITSTARIGSKSITLHHDIINVDTNEVKSVCDTTMVGFNYSTQQAIEIPEKWRDKITQTMICEETHL